MRWLLVVVMVFMGCSSVPAWRVAEDTRTPDREAFRDALADRDAVRAMGRMTAPELVPELEAALRAPKTRALAAWAMGQYGLVESFDSQVSPAPALTTALRAWVGDGDAAVRAAVAVAAGRLRDEATVRVLLADTDATVRAAAVLGLFWCSTLGTLTEESLVALLTIDDPTPEVRSALAIAFSRKPDARAEPRLRELAKTGGETAMFAVRGLGRLKAQTPETVALLRELATSGERAVRIEAILAISDIAKIAPSHDPDVGVRAATAMRVGAAADETSGWVRALGVTTKAKDGFDARWLDDPDARVRAAAAAQLAHTLKWSEHFDRAFFDASLNVRLAALESLGAIEGEAPTERLRQLLRTLPPDPTLRGAAVEAASARKTSTLVPDLVAVAQRSPDATFVELRETVVTTLAELEAWTELATFTNDPAPSVRAKVAAAIAKHEGQPTPALDRRAPASPYLGAAAARELVLDTSGGRVVITFARTAPTTAAAITALAKRGFYDGTPFHRLVPNFVLQGGDPTGTGWGDAGFHLRDEVSEATFDTGTVGLAKAGPDTGSCQLFITLAPTPHLEGRYTLVGHVSEGLAVVQRLELGATITRATVR